MKSQRGSGRLGISPYRKLFKTEGFEKAQAPFPITGSSGALDRSPKYDTLKDEDMVQSLLFHTLAGMLGLWAAVSVSDFFPGILESIRFEGTLMLLLTAGGILGIVNAIVRPLLQALTFPLRFLTLGLSVILVNMAMVWGVDILFPELIIPGFVNLLWVTLIVWGTDTLLAGRQT